MQFCVMTGRNETVMGKSEKQIEKEKEDRLTQIREASQIEIGESIVSLNLINII